MVAYDRGRGSRTRRNGTGLDRNRNYNWRCTFHFHWLLSRETVSSLDKTKERRLCWRMARRVLFKSLNVRYVPFNSSAKIPKGTFTFTSNHVLCSLLVSHVCTGYTVLNSGLRLSRRTAPFTRVVYFPYWITFQFRFQANDEQGYHGDLSSIYELATVDSYFA